MAADPFVTEQPDGRVSFTFHSAPGYDRIDANVDGTPEFVAKAFGINVKEFDGKLSTLMEQSVVVDEWFKRWHQGGQAPKA